MSKKPEDKLPVGIVQENPNTHNYMPKPCYEITADEFWHYVGTYGFGGYGTERDFRQVRDLPGYEDQKDSWGMSHLQNVYIFWYHDRALAVRPPVKWRCRRESDGPGSGIIYEESPRFYRIGCEHEYKTISWEKHDHYFKCSKCGQEGYHDTSG